MASKLTVEAEEWSETDISRLALKQGQAIARELDDQILALFSGFSTSVTATTILTVDDVLDSVFNVHNGLAGGARQLVTMLEVKGANELKKEVMSSGASVFSQPGMTSLLGSAFVASNGIIGEVPGTLCFSTVGHPTGSGDDIALTYNPDNAMAGLVSPGVRTQVAWKGSEGGYWEVYSWIFADFVEWNDEGGIGLRSDT